MRIQIVMILTGDFLAALLLLWAGNALGDRMKKTLAGIPVYGQEQCR